MRPSLTGVMAGLVPAIHALLSNAGKKDVDARVKPGMTECGSTLMRTLAGNFFVGRLFEFLNRLAQNVHITVKPTRKAQGEMEVVIS